MWNQIAELAVTTQWVWTPPTPAEWFRFEFLQLQEVKVDLAQGDGSALFSMPIRVTTNNTQILQFRRPPLNLTEQSVAVRTGDRVYRNYSLGWLVRVFTSDDEDLMPVSNPVIVNIPATSSSTAAITPVASSATSIVLLAANANRKDVKIFNNSTSRLYVAFLGTASIAACSLLLEPGGLYEGEVNYTGVISGIWAAVNGNALVTELT